MQTVEHVGNVGNVGNVGKQTVVSQGSTVFSINVHKGKAQTKDIPYKEPANKRVVGIIGLGLLGGSLAKALKAYTDYEVIGYARRQSVCDEALSDGSVSRASTDVLEVVRASDIIVLALPPETNGELFKEIAPHLKIGQVVTDVSSTKSYLAKVIYEHIPAGVHFVSVHPMAGSEKGGYGESSQDLFCHMGWIVLDDPEETAYDAAVADELAHMGKDIGSRIERIPLNDHDGYLAMVSHMPHLMASMMIHVVGDDELGEKRMRLSAGGLRDSTRTAGGLPSMWKEIMYTNRDHIKEALDLMRKEIDKTYELLSQDDDGAGMESYLERGKELRDRLPYVTVKAK